MLDVAADIGCRQWAATYVRRCSLRIEGFSSDAASDQVRPSLAAARGQLDEGTSSGAER